MSVGGSGVVSVVANIEPKKTHQLTESFLKGDLKRARKIQFELYDLFKVLFIETNPGPVKYAAELMGLMNKKMRLPLTPPLEPSQNKIKEVLKHMKLI
jgi:4-hydroxy-tetrahydrodipicolinate synthase